MLVFHDLVVFGIQVFLPLLYDRVFKNDWLQFSDSILKNIKVFFSHEDSEYWARWFEIAENPDMQAFVDIPIQEEFFERLLPLANHSVVGSLWADDNVLKGPSIWLR